MYLILDHASGYIEEKEVNKYFICDSADEIKSYLKNTMMFLMELQTKSKKEVYILREMLTESIFGIWVKMMQLAQWMVLT